MFYSSITKGFYDKLIHGDNIPADAIEISTEEYHSLLQGQSSGKLIEPNENGRPVLADPAPLTQAEIIAQYERELDAHLDGIARQYRYDDRKSFALRAGYAGPYQAEGIAFAQWMDQCNVQSYALLQAVLAGNTPMPTVAEFIGSLPAFVLP